MPAGGDGGGDEEEEEEEGMMLAGCDEPVLLGQSAKLYPWCIPLTRLRLCCDRE